MKEGAVMKRRLVLIMLSCVIFGVSWTGEADACFSRAMSLKDKMWDDFYERLEDRLFDRIEGKY